MVQKVKLGQAIASNLPTFPCRHQNINRASPWKYANLVRAKEKQSTTRDKASTSQHLHTVEESSTSCYLPSTMHVLPLALP